MMSDLMSKGELLNKLATVQTLGEAYGIIQEMPTVDAVPVSWIKEQAKKRDKAVASILMLTVQEWKDEQTD